MGTPFKVLVTGANGQLGKELVSVQADSTVVVVGYGRDRLDITDMAACRRILLEESPDAVIHCAAYTAVDQAESEPDIAYRINAAGTRNMVVASEEIGAKFCYISTDYVFDGRGTKPYHEYDRTDPQSVYGMTKLAGEQLTQSLSSRYYIVRTSWVYGKHGNNFVKTMLKLGAERDCLKVVHDQIGSPTCTLDLARFLLTLVTTDSYGIYHASNTGMCSWYEFAQAIFAEAGMEVRVEPCTTEEFPRPALRPSYSVMDHGAIRSNQLPLMRPWREALKDYLQNSE